MPIKFECEHCSQSLEADDDMAGEYIPCPHCERLIGIPKMSLPPAVTAPAVSAPPVPRAVTMPPKAPQTSGLAIASMVVGILSLVGGWMCCGVIIPIVAIVMGHIAFSQIQRSPETMTGKGMAIAGFTIGYVALLLAIIVSLVLGTAAASMTAILNEFTKAFGQIGVPQR